MTSTTNIEIHRAMPVKAFRRLLANPMALGAIIVLVVIVMATALAPLLTSADPNFAAIRDAMLPPLSPNHLLGTDASGRDILSRLLYGGRVSLLGALLALAIAALIGIPSGLLAGYYGRWFDSGSVWFSNLIQSLPGIVVLLAVRAVLGPSIWISMAIYGVILSPGFYRVARTAVINVRGELYVDAARVSGLRDGTIIGRHIFTVVRAPVIIQASLLLGVALAIQSGLEFLGIGDNNVPSWGNMLNEGFKNIYRAPVMIIWPTVAIGLVCAALVILGNGLRDALEERGATAASNLRGRKARSSEVADPIFRDGLTTQQAIETVVNDREGVEWPTVTDVVGGEETPVRVQSDDGPGADAILRIRDLSIGYGEGEDLKVVVRDVNLQVRPGEVLGLVGESGSGKSQTAFSVLGILPTGGRILDGSVTFEGTELRGLSQAKLRTLRGTGFAYIPQEPMSNLDPSFRIGSQLIDPLMRNMRLSRQEATAQAIALLERVGITNPQRTFDAFPHEISGGMAQRVLIAGAVSCKPRLLIADEPTTALDVTVQAEVLELLRELTVEYGMAVIMVTHNFGVVADICDRVAVMKGGTIIETADVETIFAFPQHPYTKMLLASTLEGAPSRIELDAEREAKS